MTHHENLKILAFVGNNEQKNTIIHHLTEKGYPKVNADDMASQIKHLIDAGQHHIVTGDLTDFHLYEELRRDYNDQLTLIGIAPAHDIEHYKAHQKESPEIWESLEKTHHTDLLPLAHYYLNDRQDLIHQVTTLLEDLKLT